MRARNLRKQMDILYKIGGSLLYDAQPCGYQRRMRCIRGFAVFQLRCVLILGEDSRAGITQSPSQVLGGLRFDLNLDIRDCVSWTKNSNFAALRASPYLTPETRFFLLSSLPRYLHPPARVHSRRRSLPRLDVLRAGPLVPLLGPLPRTYIRPGCCIPS